jgi:hypothetical protein
VACARPRPCPAARMARSRGAGWRADVCAVSSAWALRRCVRW